MIKYLAKVREIGDASRAQDAELSISDVYRSRYMIMDTGMQQSTDVNSSILVTQEERQAVLQKLAQRFPMDFCRRIETQAFERSQGAKVNYFKLVHSYCQSVQTAMQNRANQRQATGNANGTSVNPPAVTATVGQQQTNVSQYPMVSQTMRFATTQQGQTIRVGNPQQTAMQQMTRLHEPQKHTAGPTANTTTTIDLTHQYPIQPINGTNGTDYYSLQHRFPQQQATMANAIRARTATNTVIYSSPASSSASTNNNDVLHQFVVGNPSNPSMPTATVHHAAPSDQLLQRMLANNADASTKPVSMPNRSQTMPQAPVRMPMNNTGTTSLINSNPSVIRPSSSSSSPSMVLLSSPSQPSTVQIQPSNNITVQHSPLSSSTGPMSTNSQLLSMSSSTTPAMTNYSSPSNRPAMPSTGTGSVSSPDGETLTLIKYLKENVGRLQMYIQKFTSENNADKLQQVQTIQQQIVHFINNPRPEGLNTAKHFREMLEKIPHRNQPASTSSSSATAPTMTTATTASSSAPAAAAATTTTTAVPTIVNQPPMSVFTRCTKTINEFLQRDSKERLAVTKRYLEPLSDVINGVPHKIIRLDGDQRLKGRVRASPPTPSFLSVINEEIHQLPADVFSIERISVSRLMKNHPTESIGSTKSGIILRCKLLGTSNPIVPALRLHIPTRYPEQAPEILSLTKTLPPQLEFSEGHPFFEQISSIFLSHLLQLPAEHTISDILHLWRQSVQTAM